MTGLLFLALGSAAAALMSFSPREIGSAIGHAAGGPGSGEALRRSARIWEAAARNAWILGVLGSVLSFTAVLGGGSGGIADITVKMVKAFVLTLYGLILAVVCLVPAVKLPGRPEAAGTDALRPAGFPWLERAGATLLFMAVLILTVLFLVRGVPQDGPLPLAKVILHGPAMLVVLGGGMALSLFMGRGAGGRALTLGFSLTGLIGLLMGLLQAMFGFAHADIVEISAALAFIISAASYTLLGLVVVAFPVEDREAIEGRAKRSAALSRTAGAVFPLLAFLFLLLTFLLVITPMKKPG
jgi:hypothetical protein